MTPSCVAPETRQEVAEVKLRQVVLPETVEAQNHHLNARSTSMLINLPSAMPQQREALRTTSSSRPHVKSRDCCIPAARELKRPRRLESRVQTDIYLAFETITDVRRRNPAL